VPPRVERCVESLLKDPNFKPKKPGQSKKDAAWALCTWLDQRGYLKDSQQDGVRVVVMSDSEIILEGPFRVVLPITGARREIVEKSDGEEDVQLWLHVEASGPERDADGDRFSVVGLQKMVDYAEKSELPFLDGHHRDLMAAMLGTVYNPYLTDEKHFAFDVLLDSANPFAVKLFSDVLAGKRHGASIAGIVHSATIEEYSDGNFGRVFHDVELVEVSRTSWPSYRDSFITLMANKVGKMPRAEWDATLKRRQDVLALKSRLAGEGETEVDEEMIVKTDDGGVEVWEENEAGEYIQRIASPHGWDKKFKVSDKPWSTVTDRSKPCQYAIVKKNEDGSFSVSKSGYPHHMPDCSTVNRGGVIAAAVRLVQALKSQMPEIEIPPILTLADESIGLEELEVYGEKGSRFTTDELKYAARHILKHYRRDLEMTPPENLVTVSKSFPSDDLETAVELIRGLVLVVKSGICEPMEDKKMGQKPDVVEVIAEDADTPVVESAEETEEPVTETAGEAAEPASEDVTPSEEEEAKALEQSEVVGEPEVEEEEKEAAESLASVVDARLLARKFSELTYAMQEMVREAIREKDQKMAAGVIDDFARMAKDVASRLIASGQTAIAYSLLGAFEERIELQEGRLTKARVERWDEMREALIRHVQEIDAVMHGAPVVEEEAIEKAALRAAEEVKKRAEVEQSELEVRVDEEVRKYQEKMQQVDELAKSLLEPEPPAPKTSSEPDTDVEVPRESVFERWLKTLK